MKRRILLVDDEVAVLLTMKAVLEISGFEVETAASAREGKLKIRSREYDMVITDMRMENDSAGRDVILAARTAPYHPAVALLTSFPDDEWADIGADKMLVKPMQTGILLRQIEKMLDAHAAKLQRLANSAAAPANTEPRSTPAKATNAAAAKPKTSSTAKKSSPVRKSAARRPAARKKVATKKRKR